MLTETILVLQGGAEPEAVPLHCPKCGKQVIWLAANAGPSEVRHARRWEDMDGKKRRCSGHWIASVEREPGGRHTLRLVAVEGREHAAAEMVKQMRHWSRVRAEQVVRETQPAFTRRR